MLSSVILGMRATPRPEATALAITFSVSTSWMMLGVSRNRRKTSSIQYRVPQL